MANKVIVRSFLVALVLGVVISLKGQNKATISFSSDKLTGVKLYKPIDGTFQYTVLSDIVDLKPNIKVSYDLEVDDFSCIRLLFPGIRIALILFPGDEVALKYTDNGEVLISGSNAEGHRYYNDSFISSGTMFYVDKIRYIAKNTPSVEKIAVEVDSVIIKEVLIR
ncbi:MAG: hypothetical protein LBG19_07505 [Prevotellaceae bacterium]|jgi:hypothetical protein|nr:hypothetical protein [Prevotellaceae bacterium]